MPGYDGAVPVESESVKPGMLCVHCKHLLKEPLQTEEGLRVCKTCATEIQQKPYSKCDHCGVTVETSGTYPDRAIARDIRLIVVYCIYSTLQCDWTGPLSEWEGHVSGCVWRGEACPHCHEMVVVKEIAEHKSGCGHRVVQCSRCGVEMQHRQLEGHYELCAESVISCLHCNHSLKRKQLQAHKLDDCTVEECLTCGQEVARSTCVEIGATQCVHLTDSKLAFQHHQSLMRNITVITAELTFLKTSFETALADILNKDKALSTVNSNTTELQEQLTLRMSSVEAGLERVKAEIPSNTREHPIADKNIGEKVKQLEMQLVDKSTLLRRQGEQIQELRRVVDHIQSTNEKRGFKGGASGVKDVRASGVKDVLPSDQRLVDVERQVEQLTRQSTTTQGHLEELELQLQASLASTHNGSFLWRVPNIARRKREAVEERITSIYSPPFYTGRNGYKMCVRAYLNGDGSGYNTHLSLFFVIMKGEFDNLLKWPFDHKVSMILVDQNHRKHVVQTFKPSAESSSFQQPRGDMNVASGCPQFARLSIFDDINYIKDDVLFIKCIVDTTKIFHP